LSKTKIKICGIKDINILDCCIDNKIDYFGLIFFNKSCRNISLSRAKKLTSYSISKPISSVGVFVDKPMQDLKEILSDIKFDYVQLHGSEDNNYIDEIKKNYPIKIIKVLHIKKQEDFKNARKSTSADMFLLDYKPSNNELPGGNAKKFSWSLLSDINLNKPWFLSGGININNINEIKNYATPFGIDISSGVEEKPGIKSREKIFSLLKNYES
tara:strand:- start:176 stop:814 length:639 start_codon:yes stop_codon:yes gene_type:complete